MYRCSTNLKNIKNHSSDTADKSFLYNMCKTVKRMSRGSIAPTTQSSSNRFSNVNSRRGSASQSTTPPLATQHITRRTLGSGSCPTMNTTKGKTSTCDIPSHINMQQQLDKFKSTMDELQIQYTNNTTLLNFLKQENHRLTGIVYNLQTAHHTTTTSREHSQQLSAGTQGHHSSLIPNNLENSIYIKNNSFVTHLNNNSTNSTNKNNHISINKNNYINNHQPHHQNLI